MVMFNSCPILYEIGIDRDVRQQPVRRIQLLETLT